MGTRIRVPTCFLAIDKETSLVQGHKLGCHFQQLRLLPCPVPLLSTQKIRMYLKTRMYLEATLPHL